MSPDLFTLSVLGAKSFVVLIFLLVAFRLMGKREIAQFIGKTNGLPEAAQVFPARRSGSYVG